MRETPMSILAIFAHPDDEIGIGSSLSHYAGMGVVVNLTCASRGEAATIFCDDCATRENLAEVRTRELECACRHLGVAELRWLDWPDGGVAAMPRTWAVGQVVRIIRELQPDIIITHPENGLYPHPDHLAVWEITRAAFDAAANPDLYPGAGKPWAAARLFTRAIPQSFFDAAPAFAQYRVQLKGEQLPFYATPDEAVDVVMEVSCCVEYRQAAWECHRSQHNPDGAFSQMPEEVRQAMWENEHYVLAAARAPLPSDDRHDLLAGLNAWTATPSGEPDLAGILRANLAARRAYVQIEQEYFRFTKDAAFRRLLEPMPEEEQEFIYILAQALRRADGTPGEVTPDQRLIIQGLACRTLRARARFLLAVARHDVAHCAELAGLTADTDAAATWTELVSRAQSRLVAVDAFAESA
jgi:mycothiol S-conjugate amidase